MPSDTITRRSHVDACKRDLFVKSTCDATANPGDSAQTQVYSVELVHVLDVCFEGFPRGVTNLLVIDAHNSRLSEDNRSRMY